MTKDRPESLPERKRQSRQMTAALSLLAVAIPFAAWLLLPRVPALGRVIAPESGGTRFPESTLTLQQVTIGPGPGVAPQITHVQVIDFDEDGANDIIACDAQRSSVLWYRRTANGAWEERVLGRDLVVPAHATVADIDRDGDRDVLVAILGNIWPDDGAVGRLILLENRDGQFAQRVLLDNVRRVADVQAGDLDGDDDLDLVVAVFGYARGSVLCLENVGSGNFRERELLAAPGTIHVLIADYDADGDPDITAIVSQDEDGLYGFENLGDWKYQTR
ncbi:MAG: VCBS repeat-containing protein, partial [Planctomycetaceae bacterium]|nr:VCBS repeat-containing protein [Planctomycetaceae bacterium]